MKIHYRDLRLYVNAGMQYPTCYNGQGLLDIEKGRLVSTGKEENVTCQKCIKKLEGQNLREAKNHSRLYAQLFK